MQTMDRAAFDAALDAVLVGHPKTSDILFACGRPPQVEEYGDLKSAALGTVSRDLTPADTEHLSALLMERSPKARAKLEEDGAADLAHELPSGVRLRVNIFRARGRCSVVLRVLAQKVPTLDDLQLPSILEEIPKLRNGLVLVVGSTGSGKSTTLAGVIDRINATRAVHVVTLEDPIEFSHRHQKSTINQRELGLDFAAYADGLKAALRQAPKVILIGEIRDRETLDIALKAAETGQLVLSTLHTVDAGQTISRMTGLFQPEERQMARNRLSQVLRYVVAQRLLPKEGGGRIAALEVMGSNLRVRELIENGETTDKTLYQAIHDSKPLGWQTFDQHIVEHFEKGLVTRENACSYATDVGAVGRAIDQIRSARGEATSNIGELTLAKPAWRPGR